MANKIKGTKGDDVLKGTKKKDIIIGKGGDDVLVGKGGNDVLKGGKGNDKLKGGSGKDDLKGGSGNDDLKGGSGKDLLFGGKDSDYQWGGAGADIFKFQSFDGTNVLGFFEDIIFDYADGADRFDIPGLGIDGVNLITIMNYEDPVGNQGAYVVYGTGGNDEGSFFVSGYSSPGLASFDDFI